jgi:PAS domain S-box-containing protein
VQDPEHLRLVVDAAPIAIIVADCDGRITLANAQGARIFGYEGDELLGRPIESLVPDRFQGTHTGLRSEYLQTMEDRLMGAGRDLYGLRKDGTEVAIEIGLHPITTPQGNFTLAAIVDITEPKHAEEMRLQRDRALDASQLKSQFVATMSHELRTPLNAIIGTVELLSNSALDDRQRAYLNSIETSAEALLAVISSILDFSKIWAGRVDLEAQDFELDTLLTAAADVVAQNVRQKRLTLDTFVDPLIPRVLRGDPDRLRQILLNLVGNAVKFTQSGHIVIRALPGETSGSHVTVRFEVQDTGVGIAREILPQLFSPFVQGDGSASRKYGGTGLGLAISKRLVELMQGEIGVTSEPDAGSLFWFTARLDAASGEARLTEPVRESPAVDDMVEALAGEGAAAHPQGPAPARSAEAAAESAAEAVVSADAAAASATDAASSLEAAATSARGAAASLEAAAASAMEAAASSEAASASASAAAGTAAAAATAAPAVAAPASYHGRGVLIADDNADLQAILVDQFAELGMPVTIVSDGAEAVAAVRRRPFALVFMDCQMPNIDGFAATRTIRDDERTTGAHIPIVAVTANAFNEDRAACLAAGMDDYLSKPVRINDFRTMIERWIGARHS